MNIWQPGEKDLNEIYMFEGLSQLNEDLMNQLILKGWQPYIFEQVKSIVSLDKRGGIIAYYSEHRDSILIPGDVEGVKVTYEVTRTKMHLHSLGFMQGTKN